jgi:large subunit ribosomal protein L9
MGKMDQFKWKPNKKKPNKKPKFSVILKEPIEGLGSRGQMVGVERGFARNFLIPQGKAAYPTKENIQKYLISSEEAAKTDPEAQVSSRFLRFLKHLRLTVERKEGTEFSIGDQQLSLEYRRQHQLVVPPHCIDIKEPMTSFGDYTVNVSVRDSVNVPMKVSVEAWKPRIANRWKSVLNPDEQQGLEKK